MMTIEEYKRIIDTKNVDELIEIVRLARLSGDEKVVLEEADIYEKRLKEISHYYNIEPRKVDKLLHSARNKIIRRVLNK